MENAADALKIGFALLIFVVAITIVFMMISKVKYTADSVLYYADRTNYQQHMEADDLSVEPNKAYRTVNKSDVISTLYRYYNESIAVTVDLDGKIYVFDKGNEKTWDNANGTTKALNLNTEQQIESNLKDFIEGPLKDIGSNPTFIEEFVEVPISGMYLQGDDGSEIVLSSGGKKVYVTYTYK